MNKKILFLTVLFSITAKASEYGEVMALAKKNGLRPSREVIRAIVKASRWYKINALDLTAIGILETGLGKYNQDTINKNGTIDTGIFQINTVNRSRCAIFDLNTIEGSAFCAAKLLSRIKHKYEINDPEWLARYHSATKSHKQKYFNKLAQVLAQNAE
jgi:hypothetical protein